MSLRPDLSVGIPEETMRVAKAAFPRGCMLMILRDDLGPIFHDQQFASLFPALGQPAATPWRLALITLLQFAEGLSDRQAAGAVRSRIDWKYLLALSLTDAGFDHTVLCEFRARLIAGRAEAILFDAVLDIAKSRHLVRPDGRQRTDSTRVVAAVRGLNRMAGITEAMRHALEVLAVAAPDWLRVQAAPHWVERYQRPTLATRLPRNETARQNHAREIGGDGHRLLAAIFAADAPTWLRAIPAVETLRLMWVQQFMLLDGEMHWRTAADGIPPAVLFVSTPHDVDAHYARKNLASWVGYKVHLTETCDADAPPIITHVRTTTAPVADDQATEPVHEALEQQGILPSQHFVDTGYLSAGILVETRQRFGVDLIGPVRRDMRWQAQAGKGFTADAFQINWDERRVTCPRGAYSSSWTAATDNGATSVFKIKFSRKDCGACSDRVDCAGAHANRRSMTLRMQDQHEALKDGRQRQQTAEFARLYACRAGIEATISYAVRAFGMRHARYIGQAKAHLQHLATAAAMNLMRLARSPKTPSHGQGAAGYPVRRAARQDGICQHEGGEEQGMSGYDQRM
ncbi:IS1182 family transposase [Mesorhizobium sp. M0751]|uniref:IS1182 family transposase n=1 Tax=unclassified Mesorhizobium TaxID=325217 RepID=UPI003338B057